MSEKRLGRGLEALLGPISRDQAAAAGALRELPVSAIKPNPFQPRRDFDEVALGELASSIEASGLLQPVVVRSSHGGYELIAGERRWRAVQRLGWQKLPAVVKEVSDQELLTLALIENLQRDELSPIDTARGYERLHEQFKLSHADVARLVGKNRSTVANSLRLLQLPADVQSRVQDRTISEGHARALLAVTDPAELSRLAAQVAEHGWSVRETEALVRGEGPVAVASGRTTRRTKPPVRAVHAEQRRIEDTLRKHLGTDVRITAKRKGRGTITISYYSNDDMARVLELILGRPYE
ncbi:MAG TPA: ParB/RepB/Spo0J family partition protein [Gemmatimonadales bacterium]